MDKSALRNELLEILEDTLEAQLRAVRRLRTAQGVLPQKRKAGGDIDKGMSQVDMAYDIISGSPPLHVNEIIAAIRKRFGAPVDRESLVSALSKRIVRGDRFARAGKNVFTVLSAPPT